MERKNVWILGGVILLGAVILSFSQAVAQRGEFRTEPRPGGATFPRYQVVNVTEGEVIIMDVTTGDLYSAKPKDVKPYSARPRPESARDVDTYKDKGKDKDRPFSKDKDFIKDKDFFKDKDSFKDKG